MIYLIIIIIIVLALIIIPVKFRVDYRFDELSRYRITIFLLFGLIIRTIDSEKNRLTKKVENENNNNSNNKNNKDENKFKFNLVDFIQYIIDKGNIESLYLVIDLGISDPAILGVSVGIIWATINFILAYFFRHKSIEDIEKTQIQVKPLFNKDMVEINFSCIIRLKLVYIIIVYLKNRMNKKGGDSIARASNRRLNANYNE